MPPVEMQQHVSAFVRIGGLPRPVAFHADGYGHLHLSFADGATADVDAWANLLEMPAPQVSAWGRYVSWSAPGAWYGWAVFIGCDLQPVAPNVQWLEYGDRLEARAPAPDSAHGLVLGYAFHRHDRPGQDDYLVILRGGPGPTVVADRDAAVQALVTGRVPA